MLKYAFWLGVKLALEEESDDIVDLEGSPHEGDRAPAELLAEKLRKLPDEDGKPPSEYDSLDRDKEIEQFNFGHKNYSWAFDDLSRFGLDIQAPTSTAV